MVRKVFASLALSALFGVVFGQAHRVIYDNAAAAGLSGEGLITGPRPAGGFYSLLQHPNINVGFGADGVVSRLGDNFSITGKGAFVDSVTTYAYAINSIAPIDDGAMEIRRTSTGGPIVATSTAITSELTDIYRTDSVISDFRRVQRVTFHFNGEKLTPGSYWITFSAKAGILEAFFPTLTASGITTTPGANARRSSVITGGWNALLDTGGPQDLPFFITGSTCLGNLIAYDAAGRIGYELDPNSATPSVAFTLPGDSAILGSFTYVPSSRRVLASSTGTSELCEVDVQNNNVFGVGPFGGPPPFIHGLEALEGDNVFGVASLSGGNQFLRINSATGAATAIGSTGLGIGLRNMAYDGLNSTLYLADTASLSLYSVNVITGNPTLLAPLSGPTAPGGMAFDNLSNTLYLIETNGNLWSVNQASGICTLVGDAGSGLFQGLYFVGDEIAPPFDVTVTSGMPFGGTLASLLASDDEKFFVLSDELEPVSALEIDCRYCTHVLRGVTVSLECGATRDDVSLFIELLDVGSSQYEFVGAAQLTLGDAMLSFGAMGSQYGDETGNLKMRLRAVPQADLESSDGWSVFVDLVSFQVFG